MNDKCTIYRTADFIGKRWTLLILLEIYKGNNSWKRYNQVKKSLSDITPKMLSKRLKELEDVGMIKKRIDRNEVPIKCEYSLSSSGEDFIRVIKDMKKWALKWNMKNKTCNLQDCKHCIF